MKSKKSSGNGKSGSGKRRVKDLPARKSQGIKGGFVAVEHGSTPGRGGSATGGLDAGLHFKYDIKGNKEG